MRLDALVEAWAGTSGMPTSMEQAAAEEFSLVYLPPGMTPAGYDPVLARSAVFASGGGGGTVGLPEGDFYTPEEIQQLDALHDRQQELARLIGILERFNGRINRPSESRRWRDGEYASRTAANKGEWRMAA